MKLIILKMLFVNVFMIEIMKNDRDFIDLLKLLVFKDILGNNIFVLFLKILSNIKFVICF